MVQFVPMTESEFEIYLSEDIPRYAEDHIKVGSWHPAEALEESRHEHQELLPDGLASKNHYLYSIVDKKLGHRVGIIWFAANVQRPRCPAFLYDFQIFDEFRGKGYGAQALTAFEDQVKKLGIEMISLHVFANNEIAQALYKKKGYEVTGIHMTKRIISRQNQQPSPEVVV